MRGNIPALAVFMWIVALWGLPPHTALAQTCSATISSVDFGEAPLLSSSPTDVTGTLSVTCTNIPLLSVVKICPSINAGSGGLNGSARRMTSGSGTLEYQLYQNSTRTSAWGSVDNPSLGTVPAIIVPALLGGSGTATNTIYGRLFGGQVTAPPGSYRSDFIGNATLFSYAPALLGASSSCTGFVGTATIRPTFSVTATPARSCTVTATALTFPVTGILSAGLNAESQVNVTCTNQTPYSVQLSAGRNPDGSGMRRMKSAAGAQVLYALFQDAQRLSPWGSGSQSVNGNGTGYSRQIAVYGKVPVQATPAPGSYTDTVIVTVTY